MEVGSHVQFMIFVKKVLMVFRLEGKKMDYSSWSKWKNI